MTHRKGAEATSVARWAVTPSIRLDGAAARSTRMIFSRHGIGALVSRRATGVEPIWPRRQATTARATTISMKAA